MPRLLVLILIILGFPASAVAEAPSLRELGLDATGLAPLLGDSQLILVHKERMHKWAVEGKQQSKQVAFVSSLQVIAAPVTTVRAVVRDFKKYKEYIQEVEEVEVEEVNGERLVRYETKIDLTFMKLGVDYTLAYQDQPNGDITWHLVSGDLSENTGRWELHALPGNKTLAIYTAWQDYGSIGFTMRAIMRAQPDMRFVIPVASAAVIMNSIHRGVLGLPREGNKPPASLTSIARTPQVPLLSAGRSALSLSSLRSLAQAGTILFVHPKQWFLNGKKPGDFLFVSAAAMTTAPVKKVQTLATSFERYPEFVDQVVSADRKMIGERVVVDWRLKLGFSIFTMSMDYQLEYTPHTDTLWTFRRLKGDIQYIYGAWEFFDLGNGQSLALYTTGSRMGDDAPAILKLGDKMPNRDLIVGVSTAAITMQKFIGWVEKQP